MPAPNLSVLMAVYNDKATIADAVATSFVVPAGGCMAAALFRIGVYV